MTLLLDMNSRADRRVRGVTVLRLRYVYITYVSRCVAPCGAVVVRVLLCSLYSIMYCGIYRFKHFGLRPDSCTVLLYG